ncbi:hypothetical protein K466DRAFT_487711, partial [Polyporus arcularius HHB13444]
RLCDNQGHAEIEELLHGLRRRFEVLQTADPEIAVADNCCHIRNAILKVFPNITVVLDVWHFMMRYLICIINGTKNPHRAEVARDLSSAILESTASGRGPAVYRSQSEQETRLQEVFDKWSAHGGVWSAAAAKAHTEQLAHVRKGCLTQQRDDVRSDGSRIEGVHKGLNHLQRSFASGLEIILYLIHDYFLRRNVRSESADPDATPFIASAHGSHHLRLVDMCAKIWNGLISAAQKRGRTLPSGIRALPEFIPVNSGESFGMMKMSAEVAAHHSLATVKQEDINDVYDLSARDILDPTRLLEELGVDPTLLHLPLPDAPKADAPAVTARGPVPAQKRAFSPSISTADVSLPSPGPVPAQAAGDLPPRKKARLYVVGTPGTASFASSSSSKLVVASKIAGPSAAVPTAEVSRMRTEYHRLLYSFVLAQARLSNFFAPRRPEFHANSSVRPCIPEPTITGATPSQKLISIATGIDIRMRSFTATDKKEFFLFMDLRERYQWASFTMSPFDWVTAASAYNQELEALNIREGRAFIKRTPRALMDFLGKLETKILARIASGNFKSKEGATAFWTRHCHAVSLGTKSQRFNHTCSRCQKIMYPGPQGADINHKKAHCSDGAMQAKKTVEKVIQGQIAKIVDDPPPYPQPAGVFSKGTAFHPVAFLQEVRTLYERVIEHKDAVTMQDLAFASMLNGRTLMLEASNDAPAMTLFKLFPSLSVEGTFPQHLLVDYEGMRYLRINFLDESAEDVPQ